MALQFFPSDFLRSFRFDILRSFKESSEMVTIPDCEGIFEPLLRILEDKMAAGDDHVDAYLRMTE